MVMMMIKMMVMITSIGMRQPILLQQITVVKYGDIENEKMKKIMFKDLKRQIKLGVPKVERLVSWSVRGGAYRAIGGVLTGLSADRCCTRMKNAEVGFFF